MRLLLSRGLTLIETVVTVALTSLVMLALTSIIQYFYRTNMYALEQSRAVNSARTSVEHAMADLREASYGTDGSYPLLSAATSSVVFHADVDTDSAVEKVRYYLSGATLYRGITKAAGSPPSYAGQPETTTLVVDNMRNGTSTPLFSYYGADGSLLDYPLSVAAVTSVHMDAATDVNPNRAPEVYQLSGNATLRNVRNASTQ